MIYSSYVYELKNWTPRRKDVLSEFQGKFFRKTIQSSTRSCVFEVANGINIEILIFFQNMTAATRTMAIVSNYSEKILEESEARRALGQQIGGTELILASRVIWLQGVLSLCREQCSQFLRQSSSLTEKSFEDKDLLQFVAEGHGIAIIDTTQKPFPQQERAKRLSEVVALAHAYISVLDDVIENLSELGVKNKTSAEQQLRKWSEFMSASYFAEPVNLSTIELSTFYRAICESQKIELHAREVTEQLRLLADLVRLDRTEAEEIWERALQRKFNFFTLFGIFLTLLSLSQATQITPKTIADFKTQWGNCFAQFGAKCLIGGYIEKPVLEKHLRPTLPLPEQTKKSKKLVDPDQKRDP